MQFTAREDISAPIDRVFAAVTDFEAFERAILRRGAEIERTDTLTVPAPGMAWRSKFEFRGKTRKMDAELTRFEAPETFAISTNSAGMDGEVVVELVQLSPRQTRLQIITLLKPRSMSAKLLVQTLRLAKGSLLKRYRGGVRKFARDLESRLGTAPGRS